MKKFLVSMLSVVAITGLMVAPSFGADKLLVKDATSVTRYVVNTDDVTGIGSVGVNVAAPLYNFDVSAGNASKSAMHFSLAGADSGGYVTSVAPNNFYLSSGAAWDNTAGGWVAKNTSAVIAGSGNAGYRIFMANTCTPGSVCAALNTPKVTVDYNGNVTALSFNPTSSRAAKDNIEELSAAKAIEAVKELNPVTFTYTADPAQGHVGFIAEDVPDLVAINGRKSLSPMDIVAVLTKVVQEQGKTIEALSVKVGVLEKAATK